MIRGLDLLTSYEAICRPVTLFLGLCGSHESSPSRVVPAEGDVVEPSHCIFLSPPSIVISFRVQKYLSTSLYGYVWVVLMTFRFRLLPQTDLFETGFFFLQSANSFANSGVLLTPV